MRRFIILASRILALVSVSSIAYGWQAPATRPARPPVTLHVGDIAPLIHVGKWLKGSPSIVLTDGKVHVVEFWATWCGWCVADMPHLSEMAKKYGDRACMMSIDVWEGLHDMDSQNGFHGADPRIGKMTRAEAFVERAGDMMAYNVALDDSMETMGTTWGWAAGIKGLPTAFIVDGAGKIAWIGYPAAGMEEVVDALLEGKYDHATADAIAAKWTANATKSEELSQRLIQASKSGKYTEAISISDDLLDAAPNMFSSCCQAKYAALTHTDPAAAAVFGQDLLTKHANDPSALSGLGVSIVEGTRNYPIAGTPDYSLAIRLLKQSFVCIESKWPAEQAIAEAYFRTGDNSSAIHWQESAVQKMDALVSKVPALGKTLAQGHQRLEKYRTVN